MKKKVRLPNKPTTVQQSIENASKIYNRQRKRKHLAESSLDTSINILKAAILLGLLL